MLAVRRSDGTGERAAVGARRRRGLSDRGAGRALRVRDAHKPPWRAAPPPGALIVGVTAHMWWWEVRYRDPATGAEIVTRQRDPHPGGPAGLPRPGERGRDPQLLGAGAGRQDGHGARPHAAPAACRPTGPGTWRGQCAEYCGEQHARMALHVVAEAPAAFDAWLAAQARPAAASPSQQVDRGREAFLAHRCNACHTVRGVSEESRLGPDLTHVGSRLLPRRRHGGQRCGRPARMDRPCAAAQARCAHALVRANASMTRPCDRIAAWLAQLQ